MNKCIKYITLAVFCTLAYSSARAQYSDDQFNPDASDSVSTLAVQPDGKILAGGSFATIGSLARVRIGRMLANGHGDTTFDPGAAGANAAVNAIAIQSDGKILVGGAFTYLATDNRSYIGRLNTNGTLDTSFNPGASGTVKTMAVQTDGKILVGGEFATSLGGQVRTFIGRLNADGTLDTSFNPTADGFVNTLAVQSDGKIIMGGDFTVISGAGHARIARLNTDGSLDSTFVTTNANNTVSTMAIQEDGKILVGGVFTTIGGQDRNRIARLNTDGSVDTAFNPDANSPVYALATQPDGKILIGGTFTTLGGIAHLRIGRLNLDGTVDTTFAPTDGASATVSALAVQADGNVLAGGVFTTLGNVSRKYIARLYPDGLTDQNFSPEADNAIYGIGLQTDNNILLGGPFTKLQNDEPIPDDRQHIARVYNDGSTDTDFDPGAGDNVYGLTVQSNGMIIATGQFTTLAAGAARLYLGRLNTNGTLDSALNPAPNNDVYPLVMQSDGKMVFGGRFVKTGIEDRLLIGRLNADGSLDTAFGSGITAGTVIFTSAVQTDDKIIIGGTFTKIGTDNRQNIGRLNADGSTDTAFNPGASDEVLAIAVQTDDKILVGGAFATLGGQARNFIGRLNSDGTIDAAFNPTLNGKVYTIALQADGKILIGGMFTTVGTVPVARKYIARLNTDGSLDTTFDLTDGAGGSVWALMLQADGKILIGGSFATIGGNARHYIARLANTEAALQSLSATNTGSAVTWTRTGTSPEVLRTTFEQSTDGSTWTYLGAGTRITDGWQLTGLSLPQSQNFYIRARGYSVGGVFNNSCSIYESIRLSYLTSLPVVVITNVSGVVTGYYGMVNYTLSGTNNANVTGTMWWTNSLGGTASFATNNPWSANVTNMSVGTNLITVYGSNVVGNIANNSVTIVLRRNDYLAADFDGDRLSDPAYYNSINWYEWLSSLNYTRTNYAYGVAGTFPVSADFDGDAYADPTVYDNKTGEWYIWLSTASYWPIGPLSYGMVGAAPVPADFDGDRLADFAVYAAGSWYAWFSTAGYVGFGPFNYGTTDAIPVAGDFDGDAKADPAIYLRGYWFAWLSSINYVLVSATVTGDPNAFPVTSDFDGDGLCDLATVNGGIWYARLSTAGYQELGPFTFNAEGWSWVMPDSP